VEHSAAGRSRPARRRVRPVPARPSRPPRTPRRRDPVRPPAVCPDRRHARRRRRRPRESVQPRERAGRRPGCPRGVQPAL